MFMYNIACLNHFVGRQPSALFKKAAGLFPCAPAFSRFIGDKKQQAILFFAPLDHSFSSKTSESIIMARMKKYLLPIGLVAALTGCESIYIPTLKEVPVYPTNSRPYTPNPVQTPAAYTLAPNHWTDVSKIRDEATRLSDQVKQGQLTKVQAAQYLNRFRIQLVGRNAVDDSVYEVYLRSAVDSQRGAITTEQSKQYIQNTLKGWQQRWPNMANKPTNPAFTNFLMEVMGLSPLK